MNVLSGNMTTPVSTAASSTVASALSPRLAAGRSAAKANAAQGGGSDAKAAGASDITSNDFLTLLVSELKNQDPTQPTDPNAYIQQLVGVNSLQQLIQINQGLSAIEPAGTNTSTGSSSGG